MYPKLATTKNSIDKQSDIVTYTMDMISTQTNRQVTISPYVTADALSRIELNQLGLSSPALIDYQAMAEAQGDDHFLLRSRLTLHSYYNVSCCSTLRALLFAMCLLGYHATLFSSYCFQGTAFTLTPVYQGYSEASWHSFCLS